MSFIKWVREWFRFGLASLFYFSGIAYLRARKLRKEGPLVRILLIHHIKNPRRFERMIKLIAHSYNPISFDDFHAARFAKDKINILLTLDDGYESWYTAGLPILERYKVPAVFFVSSGFIESSTNVENNKVFCKERLLLSWTPKPLARHMLVACANRPLITIGGHTHNHPFLTHISESRARQEIFADKAKLEEIISKPLSVFAYPFGNHNVVVENLVKEAGYGYAMTTRSDFYITKYSPYVLPRSNHGTVKPLTLKMWALGAFDTAERVDLLLASILKRRHIRKMRGLIS